MQGRGAAHDQQRPRAPGMVPWNVAGHMGTAMAMVPSSKSQEAATLFKTCAAPSGVSSTKNTKNDMGSV